MNCKKTTILGKQKYINSTTGEVEEFNVIEQQDKDFDFQKIWLAHVLSAIDEMSNAKMKILFFLIKESAQYKHLLPYSIKEIAEKTKTSYATVSRALMTLEKHNIIKRKVARVMINPDIVFKGGKQNRMNMLIRYTEFD